MPPTLNDPQYRFLSELVYDCSRINLGAGKRELVQSRLGKRLRALSLRSYDDYCSFLKTPQGAGELTHLIDAISTNHTFFFRERQHFDFLNETALPDLAAGVRRARDTGLRFWSAASSSGEEPYSLAIALAEWTRERDAPDWSIQATDISMRMLERARAGIYPEEKLKPLPEELRGRYFQRGRDRWAGHRRVRAALRDKVHFQPLNLLQPDYPFAQPFHAIFCRNVMIYFDRSTQDSLVEKLRNCLVPGGYLMIGHSECLPRSNRGFRILAPATYQRAETE